MNDSLYNPDTMSKEDIKTLFVARQPLLDELVSTIRNQPNGAGAQHLLIIAPRGMGKTTMLLMVQFAVEDNPDLAKDWQAVRFPEESYDITELADFWLKVLRYLDDESLLPKITEIERKFTNREDLREAAWALVKDWSKKRKKRIVLLVDNFDMILAQIGNQTEQARLRDILMNDGTVMLIGCAPSYFYEIQNYEQPLYNFFKIHNLNDLKFPDIEELIRRRAEFDEIPNIEELLQKNRTRIKSLEAFTGGNPRLVLMLYRIVTSSDMTEVRNGLDKLLDAVTPFYKDKTEKLPPQQRKIINEIAQYSLEKNEGISPTEIAQRIRLTPNQVSAQLKRLAENGYVRALNIRGRSSFYALSEPLYAIWAQMRFGRNAREKRNWLVQILKVLFDEQELQKEIEKVTEKYIRQIEESINNKAHGILEYLMCLLETNKSFMQNNFSMAIYGYLELDEISSIKAEITPERLAKLSANAVKLLVLNNILDKKDLEQYYYKTMADFFISFMNFIGDKLGSDKNEEAFSEIEEVRIALEQQNDSDFEFILAIIYSFRAGIMSMLGKYEESIIDADKANLIFVKYNGEVKNVLALFECLAYLIKSNSLAYLGRLNEAIANLDNTLHSVEFVTLPVQEEQAYKFKVIVYLNKFTIQLLQNQVDEATTTFGQYTDLLRIIEPNNWLERLSAELTGIIRLTGKELIRKLIEEAKLLEEFFPLVRAIDYLETKDETLIEKLSPEVRIVVEETIKTLQMMPERAAKSETKQNGASEKLTTLALSK